MKKLLAAVAVLAFTFTACTDKNYSRRDSEQNYNTDIYHGIVRGKYIQYGTVYENTVTQLDFTVPVGWHILTDREIVETLMSDITYEEFAQWDKEDYAKRLYIPDTVVLDSETGESIIIMYDNLAAKNHSVISEKEYLKLYEDIDMAGFDTSQLQEIILDGNAYLSACDVVEIDGSQVTQIFAIRSMGDYIICIVYSRLGSATTQALVDFFA